MDSGNETLPSLKLEGEAETFLNILTELVIKDPEEIETLIKKRNDVTDGPALDAIILVVVMMISRLAHPSQPHPVHTSISSFQTWPLCGQVLNSKLRRGLGVVVRVGQPTNQHQPICGYIFLFSGF